MKEQKRMKVMAGLIAILAGALFIPGLIFAGVLDPPASPAPTMHTLEEIYNKLEAIDNKITPVPGGPPAPPAKTGQITSYETGDDGDLGKGVAWPEPRFTDNSDGTVTDNLTGLIWLKDANAAFKTWADALTYCNNLAADGTNLNDGSSAGDWRLPNVRELFSLIDFSRSHPALPAGHPFTNVQSGSYCSSTPRAYNTANAWRVQVDTGTVFNDGYKTNHYFVWPVRSGN